MSIGEQVGRKSYKKDFKVSEYAVAIKKVELKRTVLKRYNQFNIFEKSKAPPFIDKSLENFFNIEIILNTFPNAKFIHTFRNPIDSVVSIYQSMLPELSWTHKIEDILDYIDNYTKIINYFIIKYPEKIMDVNLEKFTSENKIIAEDIYRFCNLKWSKRSLKFYKRNNLQSKTISFNQIRAKISPYDAKKYKPYGQMLDKYKEKYDWIKTY